MNVLMIYPRAPEDTFWNLEAPVRAFGDAQGTMPPLGLLTIASYLPEDFEVRFIDRNIREERDGDWAWADVVFLSLMLVQQDDYRVVLDRAREADVPVAVGGPYTSAVPELVEREADWVCLGEAEDIMDAFVSDLRKDQRGVVYHGGNKTDLETVRTPRYDLIDRPNDYYVMPLQYSRGCPFACEFCDIIEIYGRVPRTKSPAQVTRELDSIYGTGFRGAVFVVDDNFIGNPNAAESMLGGVVNWNAQHDRPFFYFTEASVNLGDHSSLLDAMSAADFIFVFIGIETPDFDLLRMTKKHQNTRGDLLGRLRTIRGHGIHIIAGMIVGFDGEDSRVFERQQAFIKESGIGIVLLGLLQALPNTALSRRLEAEGRLISDQDVSLNHTVEAMNFDLSTELSKRQYLEALVETTQELFDARAFFQRTVSGLLDLRKNTKPPLKSKYVFSMLRVIIRFGVFGRETRGPFFRALFTLLRHNPNALGAFYYDCFHFYHLNQHKHQVARSIGQHLAASTVAADIDEKRSTQ